MKKVKMLRNREIGDETLKGEVVYDLADEVADALLNDGHAVLIAAAPEPKTRADAPAAEPSKAAAVGSADEDKSDETHEDTGKRKKK